MRVKMSPNPFKFSPNFDLLHPARQWLNGLEIHRPQFARAILSLIPAQCPFAREIKLFGRTIACIPPLCKLNPLYEELMSLRFRCLCFLSDRNYDVRSYIT